MSNQYEITITMYNAPSAAPSIRPSRTTITRKADTIEQAMRIAVERRYADDTEFKIRVEGYPAVLVYGQVNNLLLNPAQDAIAQEAA